MSRSSDRLYELLPAFHRLRDAERGYPLRALLRVINEQVDVVEDDIAQLYENWFIETCQDWVVPYIGDLIGNRPVQEAGAPGDLGTAEGRLHNRILVPRREVAGTLGFRRRKGTLALLDDLAPAVSGWPARAVEFYALLCWAQHVNHVRLRRGRTVDLRHGAALDLIDGPFDRIAHTSGRRTIPSVGVYVWRLKSYPATHAPAFSVDSVGPHCFTFNPLGHDTPLFNKPVAEEEPTHVPDEEDLPVPIRRRAFEERIGEHPLVTRASAAYYGPGKSVTIWAPDWPRKGAPQPVPRDLVVPADLSDWRYRARRAEVGVDPVLGRMVFPAGRFPRGGVWVTYHYGFSADMGCGEYHRALPAGAGATVYPVSRDHPGDGTSPTIFPTISPTINGALEQWRKDQQALGPEPAGEAEKATWAQRRERLRAAVIEVRDSSVYREPLVVDLQAGESLQIRGADRTRPVIELADFGSYRSEALMVSGRAGSRFRLDGFVVAGGPMQVSGPDRGDPERFAEGDLCDVTIRHVTLVPGWALGDDCNPRRPSEPSLELINSAATVTVGHSIIGSISVVADEVQSDPVEVLVADSIVDATSPRLAAVGAPNLPLAFARMSIVRSTVVGEVGTDSIALAEDSIFIGGVRVGRRQVGCMRFCYVAPGSRTPRRFHCQPDLVLAAVGEAQPPVPAADRPPLEAREAQRVEPTFTSLRYGTPAYCQLGAGCAQEIKAGASDESEMGAFHDLFQPQRSANLRVRLDEYTPAGMEVEILFAD